MQKPNVMNNSLNTLFWMAKIFLFFLLSASLFRLFTLMSFTPNESFDTLDLIMTFIQGLRLDASFLVYVFLPVYLLHFFIFLERFISLERKLLFVYKLYFGFIFLVLFALLLSDYSYFSFFAQHTSIMIFGVFDDDTLALFHTAQENYNLVFIAFVSCIVVVLGLSFIYKFIAYKKSMNVKWNSVQKILFFLVLSLAILALGRGSFGMFPLSHYTPDATSNLFLNKIAESPFYESVNAYKAYKKSKSGNYDLIAEMGYKNSILKAFKVHSQNAGLTEKNMMQSIKKKTAKREYLEKKKPHVVLVMVESFGMPLLAYQSQEFNVLGALKEHFDEDILFKNFISASNGTIVSLEPLLLNIPARPNSTPYGQGKYTNVSFSQASARVYENAGYETSFVYGGNLSWRNVGNFMLKQGFEHVEGSAQITKNLYKKNMFHDWGVFDEYLYAHILKKLHNAKKPQFIFVLTTNNHPPYTIPKHYKSHSLKISSTLKEHITGDLKLAKKRFRDYAYALDTAGTFFSKIKKSPLSQNTVVALSADNNTIEGIMKYDNYYDEVKTIPFYLYLPEYIRNKTQEVQSGVAGSHKDIFPTLYNLTLSNENYTSLGVDLLDENAVHCGFNDAGVLVTKEGGFALKDAKTPLQRECLEYYKATLAVTQYLIESQKN